MIQFLLKLPDSLASLQRLISIHSKLVKVLDINLYNSSLCGCGNGYVFERYLYGCKSRLFDLTHTYSTSPGKGRESRIKSV